MLPWIPKLLTTPMESPNPRFFSPMTAKKFSDICETKPVLHSDPVRLYGFYAP